MSAVEEKTAAPAEQQTPVSTEKPAEEAKATESETKPEAAKPETETVANGDSETAKTEEKEATEGEAKEDDKSTKPPRLVGAARNRFRWFIRNGYGKDEAAELAKDPEKIKEIKEQRELNGNGKRPANGGSGNGPASKQARIASGPIRMVVSTENHPGTKLSTEQVNQIKTSILKQVVLQKDSIDVKPHFADCSFVDGYLLVQCSDGPTVEWLQQVVPKLELWKDASVRVASEKSLQRSDIYIGTFADSLQDSDKDILSFVESQNDGFDTSKWAILGRKDITSKKEVELILTLDIASGKQVSKLNFELNYKFSKVTLRKKKRIAGAPNQNANNSNNNSNNRGNNNNKANGGGGGGGQGSRRIYNAASSFVPIWDYNLPNFNGNQQRFGNNRNAGGGFNANRGQGPRQNDSNFRNQRSNNGNGFGVGGGNGPRGNQRNNPRPRSLIDQLMQTVNSSNNVNGQGRRPNNTNSFNNGGGNNMQSGGGRPNRGQNNRNQSRARPGFF